MADRIVNSETNLQVSVQSAMNSTRELSEQAEKIQTFVSGVYTQIRRILVFLSPEELYRRASLGHERPPFVIRNMEEARIHSEEELTRVGGIIQKLEPIELHLLDEAVKAQGWRELNSKPNRKSIEEIREWFSEDYLGQRVFRRFSSCPPIITIESNAYFNEIYRVTGSQYHGIQFVGTNHLVIREKEEKITHLHTLVHEQLHHASYLGGGQNMRWRDEQGNPIVRGDIRWLHEGLTELHALQLITKHGYTFDEVSYRTEVSISRQIQIVAGDEILRKAYLSGDFTDVRRRVDAEFGAGTFDHLAELKRGIEASYYLYKKMNNEQFRRFWNMHDMLLNANL